MMTNEITDRDYMVAVAETLERLQIEPQHLFGYVMWLRERYSACLETLHNIYDLSDDDAASLVAKECLKECGIDVETYGGDVSHETN